MSKITVKGYLVPNPNFQYRGKYITTSVDEMKVKADILIEACNDGSYTIDSKGIELTGRGVKCRYQNGHYEVTEGLLSRLRGQYNIMTNF